MYSPKQKEIAVQLLIRYDFAYTQVIRELGYPNSKTTLRKWLKEYDSYADLTKNHKEYKNTKKVFNNLISEKGN